MERLKRFWFDFRNGHNTYLSFFLSFINFVLISYNFLIGGFIPLWFFIILLLFTYIPLAVFVGFLHRKKQLSTDIVLQADLNPYWKEVLKELEEIKEMVKNKDSI